MHFRVKERTRAKLKSQTGDNGERKLASDHGRAKQKSGGEAKKDTQAGSSGKSGSSKQPKG